MQEGRLFGIVYHLLDKGGATAPELAEKFEVSSRTIYRDIDTLSAAGIPVYSDPGRNGGIRLLNHFVLDKVILSEREKQEILSALQGIAVAGNTCEVSVLEKLSALFRLQPENWYEVDLSRWGEPKRDNEKFEQLKEAVIRRRCVRILYAGGSEEESRRKIYPLRLFYKSRAWYVKAYCTRKEDFRLFKLNRILQWEILDEEFDRMVYPEPIDPPPCENVVLRFPREMAYRVYDEFDDSQVRRLENGDLLASAPMPQDAWLTGFLLSFGTQVEVVEPKRLREVLAEQAEALYKKYKP